MKLDRIERATLLLAVLILGFQLFVPPVVGLANNGDFHKALASFSLAGPVADEYKYATQTLTYSPSHFLVFAFTSVEQLLTLISIALNTLVSKTGTYDLRFIGAVHASLYLASLWLLLPLLREWSARRRVVFCGLILFVFGDVMYVAQLKSFYMDTPALLFLLLTVVLACRVLRWRRTGDAWGLLACALCMIASKSQHAPLGLVFAALLAWRPADLLPGFAKVGRWVAVGSLVVASFLVFKSTPWTYNAIPLFSQIFYGVLPRAREPQRELAILGLDESYRKYMGLYAYSEGSPMGDDHFVRGFLARTSYARLGVLFARRPGRAYDVLVRGMAEAGRQRPVLGNFDRSAGLWDSAESRAFSFWSAGKRAVFEGRGLVYLGYTVVLAAVFLGLLWRRGGFLPAGIALVVAMFGSMAISIFGDPLDCVRHSWVFMGVSDVVLLGIVALL
jgi:hypothetical protein